MHYHGEIEELGTLHRGDCSRHGDWYCQRSMVT